MYSTPAYRTPACTFPHTRYARRILRPTRRLRSARATIGPPPAFELLPFHSPSVFLPCPRLAPHTRAASPVAPVPPEPPHPPRNVLRVPATCPRTPPLRFLVAYRRVPVEPSPVPASLSEHPFPFPFPRPTMLCLWHRAPCPPREASRRANSGRLQACERGEAGRGKREGSWRSGRPRRVGSWVRCAREGEVRAGAPVVVVGRGWAGSGSGSHERQRGRAAVMLQKLRPLADRLAGGGCA